MPPEVMEGFVSKELARFDLPDAVIQEMKNRYLAIKVSGVDDTDNYLAAKEAHQKVKEIRINIEKKRKELKESSLAFGRAVDGEAKRLTAEVEYVENHLQAQRGVVEEEKKRIIREKEEAIQREQERLRREEEERLNAIRREQEAKERQLREEREKFEAEKRAVEQEKERLRQEAERAERQKIEAEQARLRAEREEKERKERAEQEAKERAEREERHRQEVEKAKKESAERAIREEEERKRKEKEEVERKAALAPDIEKIRAFAATLASLQYPMLTTEQAMRVIAQARMAILDVSNKLIDFKP